MTRIHLHILVKGEPLWPGYEISEFRVNITNAASDSLLDQITATNNNIENNTVQVQVNQPLVNIDQYSLMVSVSAVSPLYNEGKPNQTTISILTSKCTSLGDNISSRKQYVMHYLSFHESYNNIMNQIKLVATISL
jgi:hypothetical protein